MTQPVIKKNSNSFSKVHRGLLAVGILLAIGSAFWAAQVTRAEFEVPLVDTTDFVPTDFLSIWTYNRQIRVNATQSFTNYEGYAVGKPTHPEDGTSALYRFDGNKWVKMLPQGAKVISSDYHFNAVSGQYLADNGYAPIDIVGGKNTPAGNQRQAFLINLTNYPLDQGNYKSSDPMKVGQNILDNYDEPDNGLRANMLAGANVLFSDTNIPANSELYAVGRADKYWINYGTLTVSALAGGMHGWLAKNFADTRASCLTKFRNNPNDLCSGPYPSGPDKFSQGAWFLYNFNGFANAPGVNDNITGVNYLDQNTAYVTTSTFPLANPALPESLTNQPKSPYDRDCSGTQTSKVFRVIGDAYVQGNWKLIATVSGECFYGLSSTQVDVPSPGNGPLNTEIWIASSKGVRRLTDDGATYPSATSLVKDTTLPILATTEPDVYNRAVYSVTTNYLRSGVGQQLLLNGGFQSWTTAYNGIPNPSGWTNISRFGSYLVDPAGTACTSNHEFKKIDTGGNFSVRVEPGLLFSTQGDSTCAGTIENTQKTRPVYISQTIPSSNIEGTRYRVTGKVKVTATGVPVSSPWYTVWNAAANRPTLRQGGVMLRCSGLRLPDMINCPYSNLREIKTLSDADVGAPDPGFTNFSFEFTRAFNQLDKNLEVTNGFTPIATGDGVRLEIVCMATFGARTDCEDFKVEVVSDPPLPASSVVQVIAVGRDGLALRNDDALTTPTTWKNDDASLTAPLAGSRITLNSISSAGGTHIFAAGTATTLFQRSVGNLSGYVWLGASQPGTTGLGGLGWLSVNCANVRDSSARSLCQRQATSYGVSLDKNSTTGAITLTGRAWLGKQISTSGTNNDNEGLDLGTCLKPAKGSVSGPYNMGNSCSTVTRTCFNDTTKACYSDYDCFGRCSGDEAYLCLTDNDCSATKITPPVPALTGSKLTGNPPVNLQCSGGPGSSPNACSPVGWLTFNASDLVGANTPPSAPAFGVTFDQTNGQLNGWGRFMTPANASSTNYQAGEGWVKFRGATSNPTGTKIYGAQNCKGPYVLRCSNNSGNSCTVGQESLNCGNASAKCVNYSSCSFGYDQSLQSCQPGANTCANYCGGNTAQPCTSDSECSSLWNSNESCKPIGYCSVTSGSPSVTCVRDSDCSAAGSFCMFGAQCNVGAASSCNVYGVDFDETRGKFQGFAWSAEYGWLDFRSVQKGTNRFLQTRLGDIFSGGNIGSSISAGTTQCNATYLISAVGTISNFCTNLSSTGLANFSPSQNYAAPIPFSSSTNAFTNALGRFDLTGIETATLGANKYAQTVTPIVPLVADGPLGPAGSITYVGSPLNSSSQIALNKNVYTADCATAPGNTCKISQALQIRNADPSNNGAGILVVKGNLTITNNLQYISSPIDDLRRLASLVVVVRGDLNIENQVTNLVGSYYVDGTVYTSPEATKNSTENHYPLTVRGLMMSKQFVFNRKFAGTVESPLPSELFIFDGRLQSNPLPGMVDFASALPNTFNSSP